MDVTFHFPPELMNLLIETIPLLNKGKKDVFLFFEGAGIDNALMQPALSTWQSDKDSIGKHEITRQVLANVNKKGEGALRERREVVRRVVEFDNFSGCWDNDRLKATGLVAEVRQLVNVKDSFTRMRQEREEERRKRIKETEASVVSQRVKQQAIAKIKEDLSRLVMSNDPHGRGKELEGILNRLFEVHEILVREAFVVVGDQGEGIIEQIDGVIELDNHLYLVELKWWNQPIGKGEISQHLVRVYHRGQTRGILISASGFTKAGIHICKEALQTTVFVLCNLQEIFLLLERGEDFRQLLRSKVRAAMTNKDPAYEPFAAGEM